MKKINKLGFTLVELIVSVSISAILMIGVSLFASDGVKNITNQKISLENNEDFTKFKYFFGDTMNSRILYQTGFTTNSGVLFRSEKNYYRGGFTYVGEKSFTGIYCSGGENSYTKHIIIKNFIPFESVDGNGDIFSGNNYSSGAFTSSYFSGTIQKSGVSFSGTYFGPSDIVFGNGNYMYISDTINHIILKFDKTNTSLAGQVIAGISGNFGDNFVSGANPTRVNLNNPTGLAFGDNTLFIADTLNDRILYVSGGFIYELLNRNDSIMEPTGLYYDSSTKTLYISNSGRGEILSYFGGSDSNVFTKSDNTLKVISSGLSYPTGIKFDGTNIIYSDFLERKRKNLTLAGTVSDISNLQAFDFSNLPYNKTSDYLLSIPIKSFNFNYSSNLFSLNLEYYKLYSCIDSSSNISRTYLFKKFFN